MNLTEDDAILPQSLKRERSSNDDKLPDEAKTLLCSVPNICLIGADEEQLVTFWRDAAKNAYVSARVLLHNNPSFNPAFCSFARF